MDLCRECGKEEAVVVFHKPHKKIYFCKRCFRARKVGNILGLITGHGYELTTVDKLCKQSNNNNLGQ